MAALSDGTCPKEHGPISVGAALFPCFVSPWCCILHPRLRYDILQKPQLLCTDGFQPVHHVQALLESDISDAAGATGRQRDQDVNIDKEVEHYMKARPGSNYIDAIKDMAAHRLPQVVPGSLGWHKERLEDLKAVVQVHIPTFLWHTGCQRRKGEPDQLASSVRRQSATCLP